MPVLIVLCVYMCIGTVMAVWFAAKGFGTIDEAAGKATWWVRMVWMPGVVAIWPVLISKLIHQRSRM